MRRLDWLTAGAVIGIVAGAGFAGADSAAPEGAAPDAPAIGPSAESAGLWCFRPSRRAAEAAYERALVDDVEPTSLHDFHDRVASEPHVAGTEGDQRQIEYLRSTFEAMGLETEVQWIDAYLCESVVGEVEIVERDGQPAREPLPVKEKAVDESSADPRVSIGWNAYSGSGEVTGEVVYANYGTKEDFEKLREMGVDCHGKIVLARYGGNFRGYKAKFAEDAGAAGLIIYSDPKNVGYVKGLMYPDGGWANETYIQRGSIETLPYPGDPLTPGEPAIEGTKRLDPETLALPTIPVQPVGWAAAEPILKAMRGPVVPEEWQGGLDLNYRVEGGDGLRVRLKVVQDRRLMRTASVVATLRGAKWPDEKVIVGCHHDAWVDGAADPTCGLIIVLEMARTFAEEAAHGHRPVRSIVFAGWGAEEFGMVGSTEWVEQHAKDLSLNGVAYLNLDMAALGLNFGASASPLLKTLIADASRDVEEPGKPGQSVHEDWDKRDDRRNPEQEIGSLGGGSDHVAFYCHLGIPSMAMGAGGSKGVSYHSAYDDLEWYRKVVGDDYASAAMIGRVASISLARLANADLLPLDLERFGDDVGEMLGGIEKLAAKKDMTLSRGEAMGEAAKTLAEAGRAWRQRFGDVLDHEPVDPDTLAEANLFLIGFSRRWLGDGLPGRTWYRYLIAAPDRDSGYASWMLPALREEVEDGDAKALDAVSMDHEQRLLACGRDVLAWCRRLGDASPASGTAPAKGQ